ncbi:MAG: hypothetical protein PHN31_04920 [Candidatus Gracilibacteria bacterium]|nr:hypothetical protein [Candidatus Gracilibacteria bacterium]
MIIINQKSNYPLYFTVPIFIIIASIFYDSLVKGNYFAYGISTIDTAIHEGGHMLFILLGNQFITVAGGTFLQLLVPVLILFSFVKQKDYFGVSVVFAWLGINLFSISQYIGDAIVGRLPLLQFFGDGYNYIHDWSYMLNETGLIYKTELISTIVFIIAIIFFILFFVYSLILMVNRYLDR